MSEGSSQQLCALTLPPFPESSPKSSLLVFRHCSGERAAQTETRCSPDSKQIGVSGKGNRKLAQAQRQYLKIHPISRADFSSKGCAWKCLTQTLIRHPHYYILESSPLKCKGSKIKNVISVQNIQLSKRPVEGAPPPFPIAPSLGGAVYSVVARFSRRSCSACCVSDEAVEAFLITIILLIITLGTQGANAPEEAGILSLSAARSRIEGSLQTAWTGSYPREEREVVRD